jgi:hypothetical protein
MRGWALVQQGLEPAPSVPALTRAFAATRVRTRLDAPTVARRAHGILIEGLDEDDARALQPALADAGIATVVVPGSALPRLPHPRHLHRAVPAPEGLTWFSYFGRTKSCPWAALTVVALGHVRKRVQHLVRTTIPGSDDQVAVTEPEDPTTAADIVLDLVAPAEQLHFRIIADDFRYDFLGTSMLPRARANFPELVRVVMRHCPGMPNRGAARFRLGHPDPFTYATWADFEQETRWMLWRMGQAGAAPPAGDPAPAPSSGDPAPQARPAAPPPPARPPPPDPGAPPGDPGSLP